MMLLLVSALLLALGYIHGAIRRPVRMWVCFVSAGAIGALGALGVGP